LPDTPLIFDLFDPNDVPKTVTKGWGSELWIVNISEYCAKILKFNAGKRMSWHYHDIKIETFYVLEGSCVLFVGDSDLIEEAKCLERRIPSKTAFELLRVTRWLASCLVSTMPLAFGSDISSSHMPG
jgi:hypothetical protein